MATISGNNSNNTLTGTSSADTINGYGGNDIIKGLAGSDILNGGSGEDQILGGDGNDTFDGGSGDNFLGGENGNDLFYVNVGVGFGVINGGSGTDTISFAHSASAAIMEESIADGYDFGSVENFIGSKFNDTLVGTTANNMLTGSSGNDTLYGLDGNDLLNGGSGTDWIYGQNGNDILYFSGFGDHYDGGAGKDTLSFQKQTTGVTFGEVDSPDTHTFGDAGGSLSGIEKVIGSQYADSISMSGGMIDGAGGNDHLAMSGIADPGSKMYGGAGNDSIGFVGQEGAGELIGYGGAGSDTLRVQDMTGGTGNDTFLLDANTEIFPGNGGAIVRDFHHGEDHIIFENENPATLTHSGDIWTVHTDNGLGPIDIPFEIDGITALSSSEYETHFG